jgi:hypothetical protein
MGDTVAQMSKVVSVRHSDFGSSVNSILHHKCLECKYTFVQPTLSVLGALNDL